jgi:hypothetical protein
MTLAQSQGKLMKVIDTGVKGLEQLEYHGPMIHEAVAALKE